MVLTTSAWPCGKVFDYADSTHRERLQTGCLQRAVGTIAGAGRRAQLELGVTDMLVPQYPTTTFDRDVIVRIGGRPSRWRAPLDKTLSTERWKKRLECAALERRDRRQGPSQLSPFCLGQSSQRKSSTMLQFSELSLRRDGGTGRRSGLKIRRCLAPWGFNSPSRHQP